jgi:hypothetical protein
LLSVATRLCGSSVSSVRSTVRLGALWMICATREGAGSARACVSGKDGGWNELWRPRRRVVVSVVGRRCVTRLRHRLARRRRRLRARRELRRRRSRGGRHRLLLRREWRRGALLRRHHRRRHHRLLRLLRLLLHHAPPAARERAIRSGERREEQKRGSSECACHGKQGGERVWPKSNNEPWFLPLIRC